MGDCKLSAWHQKLYLDRKASESTQEPPRSDMSDQLVARVTSPDRPAAGTQPGCFRGAGSINARFVRGNTILRIWWSLPSLSPGLRSDLSFPS